MKDSAVSSLSDRNEIVLSVSELNRSARMTLEKGLTSCRVHGEISNYNRATSGHWYFTLKDDLASVRCVMFRTRNQFVDWNPRDGDHVELRAQPTLYEQRGDYQLVVDALRKAGQGSLYEAFLRLKSKLEGEGLLSHDRKRKIPQFPRTIGIITSPQAAALRDVLTTIKARWPGCVVILYPSPVQGDASVPGLIEAMISAGQRRECDLLLLVRGGGNLEDLLGFNNERVARAIVTCPIPIITGLGHESDFTIADFVADLRAPTPTGAAQLATPSRIDIWQQIQHLSKRKVQIEQRLFDSLGQQLDGLRRRVVHPRERIAYRHEQLRHLTWRLRSTMKVRVDLVSSRLARFRGLFSTLARDTQRSRQRVASYERRLHSALRRSIHDKEQSIRALMSQLDMLSPKSILNRGYSIVMNAHQEVLRDANKATIGEHIEIVLAHGKLGAQVLRTENSTG
jgi:exodeoxyribonuclease VII large subunit